jgi:uncharacterized surface protein with fasciclin (FAS1) repeats
MVSIGPYNEVMNFTHMFNIPDTRGPLPIRVETPGSLAYLVANHPDFSIYRYILSLSKLDGIYNDLQANFTLFIPSDDALKNIPKSVFINMDYATARHIIKSSTLNRKITSDILEDSKASYYLTNDPPNRLLLTNFDNRTYINGDVNIIHKDMMATNGIIHVIDALIKPLII